MIGRERRVRTSNKCELNGGTSCVFADWSFSSREIENCNQVDREEVTSGIVVVGLLVDCKGEAGVLSGEAGLEGIFEGGGIGERKLRTLFVGRPKPEGVTGWKSSTGWEKTERQSSQGGNNECSMA